MWIYASLHQFSTSGTRLEHFPSQARHSLIPKPHWGGLGGRGSGGSGGLQPSVPHTAAGHTGDAIPWSSHGAGRSSLVGPKEKLDTLGGSEHHFTERLDTC